MKLSIITATYNSSLTLRDTLDSVLKQDYHSIEHIIIDGASRDNTLEIVTAYPHISKIVSEKDDGIYDAMNKGIVVSTGNVIGILNSDDIYIDERVISKVVAAFSDPLVDVVYGDLQYVRADDTCKITRTWKSGSFTKKRFYYGWMPPHPTFFVRREVYDRVGLFNCTLRSAADYELMLRILLKYDHHPFYIPEILVKMRTGGQSNASVRNRIAANREDLQAWKINGLTPGFFTIMLKPLRKIFQFIRR